VTYIDEKKGWARAPQGIMQALEGLEAKEIADLVESGYEGD